MLVSGAAEQLATYSSLFIFSPCLPTQEINTWERALRCVPFGGREKGERRSIIIRIWGDWRTSHQGARERDRERYSASVPICRCGMLGRQTPCKMCDFSFCLLSISLRLRLLCMRNLCTFQTHPCTVECLVQCATKRTTARERNVKEKGRN